MRNSKFPEGITQTEEAKLKKSGKKNIFAGNSMLVRKLGECFLHPSSEDRPVLIKQYHERAHQDASTVLTNLKLRYLWPKMDVEIAKQVGSCPCDRGKSRVQQKITLRFPMLQWKPFYHLEMDLLGEVASTSHGNRWILDHLTKYVLLFTIANKDALTIAALLLHDVFSKFAIPKKLHSDKGSELNNLLLRAILESAHVDQSISSACHPMRQGSVERFNETLKKYLTGVLNPVEENLWDMVLRRVEFAYNVSAFQLIAKLFYPQLICYLAIA